jgi:hypothetical protein
MHFPNSRSHGAEPIRLDRTQLSVASGNPNTQSVMRGGSFLVFESPIFPEEASEKDENKG